MGGRFCFGGMLREFFLLIFVFFVLSFGNEWLGLVVTGHKVVFYSFLALTASIGGMEGMNTVDPVFLIRSAHHEALQVSRL